MAHILSVSMFSFMLFSALYGFDKSTVVFQTSVTTKKIPNTSLRICMKYLCYNLQLVQSFEDPTMPLPIRTDVLPEKRLTSLFRRCRVISRTFIHFVVTKPHVDFKSRTSLIFVLNFLVPNREPLYCRVRETRVLGPVTYRPIYRDVRPGLH